MQNAIVGKLAILQVQPLKRFKATERLEVAIGYARRAYVKIHQLRKAWQLSQAAALMSVPNKSSFLSWRMAERWGNASPEIFVPLRSSFRNDARARSPGEPSSLTGQQARTNCSRCSSGPRFSRPLPLILVPAKFNQRSEVSVASRRTPLSVTCVPSRLSPSNWRSAETCSNAASEIFVFHRLSDAMTALLLGGARPCRPRLTFQGPTPSAPAACRSPRARRRWHHAAP